MATYGSASGQESSRPSDKVRSGGDRRFDPRATDAMLRDVGLRPTRQRISLAKLLFGAGDRHVSAEGLHEEATRAGCHVSLATVYNTLNQFTEAGLLRAVALDSSRQWFDTNLSDHHHFYYEDSDEIADVRGGGIRVADVPEPPEGTEIERVDVIVRLRRVTG